MQNQNDLSLESIWGFVTACGVASVEFVIALCADQPNRLSLFPEERLVESSELSQKKERLLAISRYADLVANAKLDIRVINKALQTYNMEARAFVNKYKQPNHETNCAHQSILALSYFQATKEQIAMRREQEASDNLLRMYQELVQSYPLIKFESSTRLDEIELACSEFESHHSKILESAEIMLPNLYALLKKGEFLASEASILTL